MADPRRSAAALDSVAGARILIVEARYYDDIGALLLAGAQTAAATAGAETEIVSVPGALEIAAAIAIRCAAAEAAGTPFDGAVALGCIVRGETYHFEIVSNESARGLTDLGLQRLLPIGNGVLTVETDEQAQVRADPEQGDKGGDAMRAALSLIALKRRGGAR
jgi:6,7-dimethyl-8-ribityllumazine synthase